MKFLFPNNQSKNLYKPHYIDMWYDRKEKSWVIQLKDIKGNQIGDADYVYTKKEALKIKKQLEEEYNL